MDMLHLLSVLQRITNKVTIANLFCGIVYQKLTVALELLVYLFTHYTV